MKICNVCSEQKVDDDFGQDLRNSDKLKSVCKSCCADKEKNRREAMKKIQALAEDAGIRLIEVANDTPDSAQYDASCIKILHDAEVFERMPWLEAETLAAKYGKDADFVRRGLQACRSAGVGEEYFIKRYLEGDKSIPMDESVEYQSRVIQGLVKAVES
jgi:hypothetical protein